MQLPGFRAVERLVDVVEVEQVEVAHLGALHRRDSKEVARGYLEAASVTRRDDHLVDLGQRLPRPEQSRTDGREVLDGVADHRGSGPPRCRIGRRRMPRPRRRCAAAEGPPRGAGWSEPPSEGSHAAGAQGTNAVGAAAGHRSSSTASTSKQTAGVSDALVYRGRAGPVQPCHGAVRDGTRSLAMDCSLQY